MKKVSFTKDGNLDGRTSQGRSWNTLKKIIGAVASVLTFVFCLIVTQCQ